MKILIDGDSCSKLFTTEKLAKKYGIPCHVYCDTSRLIESDYSAIHIVDIGFNSADMAIANACNADDIVITNDAGLAALVLAKNAITINTYGLQYTNQNINAYLTKRYIRSNCMRKTNRKQVKGLLSSNEKHSSFAQTLQTVISRKDINDT